MQGFVPLRRGLYEHLPSLADAQVKLYVALLLQAANSGPHRGTVKMSLAELAADLGWSKSKAHRTLASLSEYVEVKPSTSRHEPTTIHILRFHQRDGTGTVVGRYRDGSGTVDAKSGTVDGTVSAQNGTVKPESGTVNTPKPSKISNLQAPDRKDRKDRSRKDGEEERAIVRSPPTFPLGEFGHALLTEDELHKLHELIGPDATNEYIGRFDRWVEEAPDAKTSSGPRRKRKPYLTLRSWIDRDRKNGTLRGEHGKDKLKGIREWLQMRGVTAEDHR